MKVFVSSTYTDLIDYRKAVERGVNLLGQQFKGMEYFGALSEEPKVAALNEVEQCDIFVGIYAHRYGFIPKGDMISITEQEFNHAKKLGKQIFCYRASAKQPWLPEFIEGGKAKKSLSSFLERVDKEFVRQEFSTPEDLQAKVTADLARYLSRKHQTPVSLTPLPPLPYFVHPYPLQAYFTGRVRERALLTDWITRSEHQTESVFALVAMGGMGKSALAWYWLQSDILSLGVNYWSLLGVFWWSFYDNRDFSNFLERAIEYASGGTVDTRVIPSDRERMEALMTILRQKRLLFVFDGFERVLRSYARMDAVYRGDEVNEDSRDDYRACTDPNIGLFLRQLASGGCLTKVLITTRHYPLELDGLDGVFQHELTGMDAADAVEFFGKQGIRGTHAEIEAVCAEYGYHPLSLRLLSGTLARDPRYHSDIRYAPRVNPLNTEKLRRILDFSYDSLQPREQHFISQLAAFRSPLGWETISAIFRQDFKHEGDLARTITDLVERGLYMRDRETDTFNLHALVHRYCYDRLDDKPATHARLILYFAKLGVPQRIESFADLQPVVELYHHTVSAGRYDEGFALFDKLLMHPLYFRLGMYQTIIELLRALFPDGEDLLPRLKDDMSRARALNLLAGAYARSGRAHRAAMLFGGYIAISRRRGDKTNEVIGLGNVATQQLIIGELKAAEQKLRQRIEICHEINDEELEATARYELGRVLSYEGLFDDAEEEFRIAFDIKSDHPQAQGIICAYRALRGLLMGDRSNALDNAREAYRIASERDNEADRIRSGWLVGSSCCAMQSFEEAEKYLAEALARDRRTNMVDHEASILLEFARLRFGQAVAIQQSAADSGKRAELMQESFNFVKEALEIADRCEYRLQQAELHSFLAEWYLDLSRQGESKTKRKESFSNAKEHAESAKERAWCDSPPYLYKAEFVRAQQILDEIEKETHGLKEK